MEFDRNSSGKPTKTVNFEGRRRTGGRLGWVRGDLAKSGARMGADSVGVERGADVAGLFRRSSTERHPVEAAPAEHAAHRVEREQAKKIIEGAQFGCFEFDGVAARTFMP